MDTPVVDFLKNYRKKNSLRLHMPGHKGHGSIGAEKYDLTEIAGADSLYEANGIIAASERNASELFGADTFYSAEGSSQCIRAMLYLALSQAKREGRKPLVFAGRNAHKTFLSAVCLLGMDVEWLYDEGEEGYLSCPITGESLQKALDEAKEKPVAVYVTSPDYLGNVLDVAKLKAVCRKYGALLLVDNAHGAYLKFLKKSAHPIDLGADMAASSAHKTLPVLTGGAYLQIAKTVDPVCRKNAKEALALFGSTSPSYLILASLDAANGRLSRGYDEKIADFAEETERAKERLTRHGFSLVGDEPCKITVRCKPYGYTGEEISEFLSKKNIVCEFADPDFLVAMFTPEVKKSGLRKFEKAICSLPRKQEISSFAPKRKKGEKVLSVREAMLSEREILPVEQCEGRILAAASVACPPAVPVLVCGERIERAHIEAFLYYGVKTCAVVK